MFVTDMYGEIIRNWINNCWLTYLELIARLINFTCMYNVVRLHRVQITLQIVLIITFQSVYKYLWHNIFQGGINSVYINTTAHERYVRTGTLVYAMRFCLNAVWLICTVTKLLHRNCDLFSDIMRAQIVADFTQVILTSYGYFRTRNFSY